MIGAAEFRRARVASQQAELRRLTAELPIRQLQLPARPTADIAPTDISILADGIDP
jgi:hypothetical protein